MEKNDLNKQELTVTYFSTDGSGTINEGGDHAWRNNNPGNIMDNHGHFAMQNGALGYDKSGDAVFPDAITGENARRALLKGDKYQNLTLEQMVERYTKGDKPELQKTYLKNLTDGLRISSQAKLKDLNYYEFERLLQLMKRQEGNHPGAVSDWPAPKPGDNASPAPKENLRKTYFPDMARRSRMQSGGGSGGETLERRGEEVFRFTADGGKRGSFHSK